MHCMAKIVFSDLKAKTESNMPIMSAPALFSTVGAATAIATTLFLIRKSRLMRVRPYQKNLTTHHRQQPKRNPEQPKPDPRGKMLFVSQIGTSKALATCLCDLLESKGVVLDLVDARNYEPEALPRENLVVLVASTSEVWNLYSARDLSSDHDLPWGAKFFVNWIEEKKNAFKVGAFVVNACSFSAFVVGRGGKNLMAKAANEVRGLGHTAESNADFDSWWGSVVAVLQGAILGVAADGICGESDPEDVGSSDLKLSMTQRLYMLVENQDFIVEQTDPYVSFSSTTGYKMLTITDDNFMKNGTVELEQVCHLPAQWPLRKDLLIYNGQFPRFQGFCAVGHCFFFAGDVGSLLTHPNVGFYDCHYSKLWCLKYKDPIWVWSLCGSMFCSRLSPLVVPYDGKLCMFGGEHGIANWVEIYSLKSGLWERREVPRSALFSGHSFRPSSYFLWEDSKKTLIVLYSFDDNHQLLISYDVKANRWEEVECNFPPVPEFSPRKLVRLGCSHYLLIVDFAPTWYIYDLSKKKLVTKVPVDGLEEDDVRVSNIFYCHHSSKESLIYIFTEHQEEEEELPEIVSYARVRLQLQTFSAKIESKGYLRVGPHNKYYIFAVGDEGNKAKSVV